MDILVHSEGFTLSEQMRAAVEEKIGHCEHYAPRALRARVTIKRNSVHPSPKQFTATVLLSLPGTDACAEKKASAPLEAVDLLLEKVERQLRRRKTERLARRSRIPARLDLQPALA